jgi:hypothetical protein
VVSGQPIGLSQLELQPPGWGGEQIAPAGFSRSIQPSAAVADLVEAIWGWDIPDGDAATAFTIKVLPSTGPYFVVQYRTLTHCRWQLGSDSYDHRNCGHVLTQTQSGTFAISPRGPLGVITVRLKPALGNNSKPIGHRVYASLFTSCSPCAWPRAYIRNQFSRD